MAYDSKDPRSVMTPLEDAKDAVITFAMYHFEAMRQEGKTIDDAKAITADMLREVYEYYCEMGNITGKGLPMSVTQRIDKLVGSTKELAKNDKQFYGVHSELVQIQAQLKNKR